MTALDKNYDPRKIEEKWLSEWLTSEVNHSEPAQGGEPYCVMIPPPNVTGVLHIGHALNNTIQDVLVRWRRMQGRNAVWIPGTDHAGIATQNVVERALKAEGKGRDDLGRDDFVKRVWQWKEEYGGTIINQLKRLGASCDWQRERFTMDEGLSNAVEEVFVRLYDKGLIYRGNYIINWCPRCQTALADEESEHEDTSGKLYYIRYPVKDGGGQKVVVATTRPETMLGDVAVAVNPRDDRFKGLIGKTLVLPILNRELVVIADDFVDPEFGTGAVKVTPAHDPNDFSMGERHDLEPINILNENGSLNAEAGPYEGMDRFACRKKIVEDLSEQGLLEKIEDHQHPVGHCYRCDTVVEPYLSEQWFVKMKPLAKRAIEVVKKEKVKFVPDRWTKVYLEWMNNIRDWCISRQIWWGHRIPVFYCDECNHEWAAKGSPGTCPKCSSGDVRQDEDVLDTWFSSWLWPFSTLGWPDTNDSLKTYYPTHDLVTASEIIFFWVARMIMAGLEFMDEVPFTTVYIHGTVRDDDGLKMSKSLGNAIDPLTIIDEFSADALRFSLMMITATGQDVYLSNEKFEIGRNFGTKLWNVARFMQMQTDQVSGVGCRVSGDVVPDGPELSPDDQYILSKLDEAIALCDESLEKLRLNDAAHALYEFVWHQYCDWYIEYSKQILYGDDQKARERVQNVMNYVFSRALRLLHPFVPFITEELWHAMGYGAESESIGRAAWPRVEEGREGANRETIEYVGHKYGLIRAGRNLRADYGISPQKEIAYIVRPASEDAQKLLRADVDSVVSLLKASNVQIDPGFEPGTAMPSAVTELGTVYMPLEGLIDVDAERERLSQKKDKLEKALSGVTRKLDNMDFVKKAPKQVVTQQEAKKKELVETIEKLTRLIEALAG